MRKLSRWGLRTGNTLRRLDPRYTHPGNFREESDDLPNINKARGWERMQTAEGGDIIEIVLPPRRGPLSGAAPGRGWNRTKQCWTYVPFNHYRDDTQPSTALVFLANWSRQMRVHDMGRTYRRADRIEKRGRPKSLTRSGHQRERDHRDFSVR